MKLFWRIFFEPLRMPEDGGGSGGDAGAAGGDKGAGGAPAGDKGAGDAGKGQASQSLRAQLGGLMDEKDRSGFSTWAQKYATDGDFVKAVENMRTTYDSRVTIPGKDAKPDDVHKFFTKLGKPAEAKDYAFEEGEGAPKYGDAEKARLDNFRQLAHRLNLTGDQAKELKKWYDTENTTSASTMKDAIKMFRGKAVEQLRAEWKADYDVNVEYAKSVGVHFGVDETEWSGFTNAPVYLPDGSVGMVGDHPLFLNVMSKIGRAVDEDTRARMMHLTGEADSIRTQIEAIKNEAIKAGKLTSDTEYHKRLEPLYAKLYPGKWAGTRV